MSELFPYLELSSQQIFPFWLKTQRSGFEVGAWGIILILCPGIIQNCKEECVGDSTITALNNLLLALSCWVCQAMFCDYKLRFLKFVFSLIGKDEWMLFLTFSSLFLHRCLCSLGPAGTTGEVLPMGFLCPRLRFAPLHGSTGLDCI